MPLYDRPLCKTIWTANLCLTLLPSSQYQVILIDKNGHRLADSAVTSLKHDGGKGVELPVDMYVVHEAAPDRDLPDIIRIDCIGLGGHDLGLG